MSSKKANPSHHESKVFLDTCVETDIKFKNNSDVNDIKLLSKKQEKLKKDLAFWNSMVDGKIQSIASCVNLFILLMILTLASTAYNGAGTNGSEVLGWICVAQVSFFYGVLIYIKFQVIPTIEAELQQNNTEGFKLYQTVEIGKKQIRSLQLHQLELLQHIVTSKVDLFAKFFPHTLPNSVLTQIKDTLSSQSDRPYQINSNLIELKRKEKNAKWWQSFWQTFILGKTFTIPGVALLVLIITPLSIATPALTSKATNNAQGWIAVGFLGAGFLGYIIIKLFVWDALNRKVENSKCQLLQAYHPVYLNHQRLNSFTLAQLEGLQGLLLKRAEDFNFCYPLDNPNELLGEVKKLISTKLPNKGDKNEEAQFKQILQKEKTIQSLSAAWTSYFNQRLITTIINVLKFLIVIAITFVPNYSVTLADQKNAKIVVGSIGIAFFVLGYLFYLFLRAYYLDHLEETVHANRSSPFTTFRLVSFGNKKLSDLQPHQIEDVCEGFDKRKEQFIKCFASIDPQTLDRQLHEILKSKLEHHYVTEDLAFGLLKKQAQAKKMLAFWTGYADNPLMTSMYSVYVLLVLMLVTITGIYDGANDVMGWVGVAVLALLITLIFMIKMFVIDYKANTVKALYVEGYSSFNQVYTKSKELSSLDIHQLTAIQNIIESNPIQFRKCFPKAPIAAILSEIKQHIAEKTHHQAEVRAKSSVEKVKNQQLTLQINRCKNALEAWNSLILDKIYAITQLTIVTSILWVQSNATSLYGLKVCGFLTVGSLSVIVFLIIFYNCYYRNNLENKINGYQIAIKGLDQKDRSILSVSV